LSESAADFAGIETVESVNGERQTEIFEHLFVNCVCQCVKILLNERVLLKSKELKTLHRYKRLLRKMALKKTPRSERWRVLQTGGFIGAILPPLISGLSALLSPVVSRLVNIMENAKRMVLVHEEMLEYELMVQHFQIKQDLTCKWPTKESVKSSFSKQMKSTINGPAAPEDVEAKCYRQHPNRFLHTKRELDDEPLAPSIDELLDIKTEEKDKKEAEKEDGRRYTKAKRTSKQISRKPQRYPDISWQTK
jgi:hypothetical protein